MAARELYGLIWDAEGPARLRLIGHDCWLRRDASGWHLERGADGRRVDVATREEGALYVAVALGTIEVAGPAA